MYISLIVGTFYPAVRYGGPIFSTLYTCRELAKMGHEVYVSTTNANGKAKLPVPTDEFYQFDTNLFVKYYSGANHRAFSRTLILNIWKDIKQSEVVSLQGMFSSYIVVSLFYASLYKKPVLLSPRGSLGEWCIKSKRPILKKTWLTLFILPFLKNLRFHATSEQEKADILKIFPDVDVVVIPNGIDPSEFAAPMELTPLEFTKRFIGRPINSPVKIISMGRLHCKKGFDILIEAFSSFVKDCPEAILIIAGPDGGELHNLIHQVKRSSLENHVFFVGEIAGKDKIDFLANGDLFVLPSHNENFGNVYAESLAAGTPIIASTRTPWHDVEKYGCGKWVENSVDEIAKAMQDMLNRDLVTMGCRGKEYINTFYTWQSIASRLINVFENMIHTP